MDDNHEEKVSSTVVEEEKISGPSSVAETTTTEETKPRARKKRKDESAVEETAVVTPVVTTETVTERRGLPELFDILYNVDLTDAVEQKGDLSYLPWARAWAELCKHLSKDDEVSYRIIFNEEGMPYTYDPATGYYVFTEVTINGDSRLMWLPVMDASNRPMKAEAYDFHYMAYGKEKTSRIQPATSTDINRAIMRCLVKNLAMFGLGLRVYNGEDIPDDEGDKDGKKQQGNQTQQKSQGGDNSQRQGHNTSQQRPVNQMQSAKPSQSPSSQNSGSKSAPTINPNMLVKDIEHGDAYVKGLLSQMAEKGITVEQVCARSLWKYCNGDIGNLRFADFTKLKENICRSGYAKKPENAEEVAQ